MNGSLVQHALAPLDEVVMRNGDLLKPLIYCAAGVALSFLLPATSSAFSMPRQTLESLILNSDIIVDCRVLRVDMNRQRLVATVKVEAPYHGDATAGESYSIDVSSYARASPDGRDTVALRASDHLFLFLRYTTEQERSLGQMKLVLVESGVKVVEEERIAGMRQELNPGPYVNSVPEGTVQDFRGRLRETIKSVAQFKIDFRENYFDAAWMSGEIFRRPASFSKPGDDIRDDVLTLLRERLAMIRAGDAPRGGRTKNTDVPEWDALLRKLRNP